MYLLGLGSNINPQQNLAAAIRHLDDVGRVISVSPALETAPVGNSFQHAFMNQLVIFDSDLLPNLLKIRLQKIEIALGREAKNPARKNKDRTIDIDILYQGNNEQDCLHNKPEDSYNQQVQQLWLKQLSYGS
ncbi:2-amino-4-hydroxy-6-hydroxymethyldihydropteridine diphosphokinase [Bacterioplanoides sp.]|uniref:2-amino-4-hydroxy-6- hydroxymethyldihydropteridine diphosphokinase n=1 Tax=Bacterioplanoides sp. TaxID=2066072 RepID=UPI003B002510